MTNRNFGIAAHVDAGKTTLAERLLFVCGRIHAPGDIKGARPTKLDHKKVERDHGITVSAAATTIDWREHTLSLVDTPGHVDFTIEVERALAVLDGAILVLCGVAGVQAQTHTVVGQMDWHGVPFVAFVNKCDHPAADPVRVVADLRTRLSRNAALTQWPVHDGDTLVGVVDLVTQNTLVFTEDGRKVRHVPVDPKLEAAVMLARERLVDAVSLVDAGLIGAVLERGEPDAVTLSDAIGRATRAGRFVPVLLGAAARTLGIPPVLDAVVDWLPGPTERVRVASDPDTGVALQVDATEDGPAVAFVFKTEDAGHGVWTWLRVYRGQVCAGMELVDGRTGQRHRVGRLARLHGAEATAIERGAVGEVVAAFGLRVPSGVTLCDPDHRVVLGALVIPEPVVEQSLHLMQGDPNALAKGLQDLTRDDPTLRLRTDDGSGETRLSGMGELHLQIAAEQLLERTGCTVKLGRPTVTHRTALEKAAAFETTLSKQTGGPGMFAKIVGSVAPADSFSFTWAVTGGAIPATYRQAIERAFRNEASEGAGTDWPLIGVHVEVQDGKIHSNDSSELAFALCAAMALREAVASAGPVLLEPVMRVTVTAPGMRPGSLVSLVSAREGQLEDATMKGDVAWVEAVVPLRHLFGFSTALRSATSGAGTFTSTHEGYR